MSRNVVIGLIVVIIIVIGVGAAVYFLRPPDAASEDVQTNTEQLDTADAGEAAASVFRISQEDSTAEFNIGEVLRGADNLVVGTTNEVAGDILVNFDDPDASEVGQIRINARTLATDSSQRDGMISRAILRTGEDDFEFVEFQPTEIGDLPDSIAVGDTFEVEITGDLTITGTTQPVTFTTTVTYDSEDQISGSAEAVIQYADFGINIPSVPSVASVEDDVTLKLNFVARAVDESEAAES